MHWNLLKTAERLLLGARSATPASSSFFTEESEMQSWGSKKSKTRFLVDHLTQTANITRQPRENYEGVTSH